MDILLSTDTQIDGLQYK